MSEKIHILMVQAKGADETNPAAWVWADRQANSLLELGCVIETYGFSNRRSLLGLLNGALALRKKIYEFKADLVHVHFGAAQAVIAVMVSSKPVVISFCGSDLLGNYDSSGRKTWSGYLSGWLSQLAALGAQRCIAKTEELKQTLWFSTCKKKCVVIPNGVNLDLFVAMPRSEARALLGWSHEDPVVLFMDRKGAWVKNRNLANASYEEAKKNIPSLRFQVVETEPPERMPIFMNAADVLLITSRHEGSNNTVKEALACNLPVVSTPVGDIPQRLAGVHPSAVAPSDPKIVADALTKILRQKIRSNGRLCVAHLSLDNVAKRVWNSYLETLGLKDQLFD
ncbi:MAG: glycosyltransferase family 4 protein [Nitrospirales bacterium]